MFWLAFGNPRGEWRCNYFHCIPLILLGETLLTGVPGHGVYLYARGHSGNLTAMESVVME